MNILVLHGPNLNLLGERELEVYGRATLDEINSELRRIGGNTISAIYQSNHEGELIDHIHSYRKTVDALIINPGALTHYSYALRDAIAAFAKQTYEIHLSDLNTREHFRRLSVLDGLSNVKRIMGKGVAGYYEAVKELMKIMQS